MKLFLKLLILYGILFRLYGIIEKKEGLSFNESVTYLCTAGKEYTFQKFAENNSNTVVLNKTITDYYVPEPGIHFSDVSYGLASTDKHPPFFFWSLYCVVKLIGFNMYTGLAVNFLLTLLCLLLLYSISKKVLKNEVYSYLVCAIWMLAPPTAYIIVEGREYQMLCFFALSSLLLNLKIIIEHDYRFKTLALFTLVNAGGFLTHYYYGFLLIPCALIAFLINRFNKFTFIYFGSLLISLGLFFLLFKEFIIFLNHYSQNQQSDPAGYSRIKPLIYSALGYFSWFSLLKYLYLFIVLSYLGFLFLKRNMFKLIMDKLTKITPAIIIFYNLIWYSLFTGIFYILGISPSQATGIHYFCYIWPLLTISFVLLISYFSPKYFKLIFVLHLAQLAISFFLTLSYPEYYLDYFTENVVSRNWIPKINSSDVLYLDVGDSYRAWLPRAAVNLKPDLKVVYGNQVKKDVNLLSPFSHISLLIMRGQKIDTTANDVLNLFKKNNFNIHSSQNQDYIFYEIERNQQNI